MRKIYKELGWFKNVLTESREFQAQADGAIGVDIERMLAALPAFITVSDSGTQYTKKILVLNNNDLIRRRGGVEIRHASNEERRLRNLHFMLIIRQLLKDGFSIYLSRNNILTEQREHSIPQLLTWLNQDDEVKKEQEIRSNLQSTLNVTFDDIEFITAQNIDTICERISIIDCVLWTSDLESLEIDTPDKFYEVFGSEKPYELVNDIAGKSSEGLSDIFSKSELNKADYFYLKKMISKGGRFTVNNLEVLYVKEKPNFLELTEFLRQIPSLKVLMLAGFSVTADQLQAMKLDSIEELELTTVDICNNKLINVLQDIVNLKVLKNGNTSFDFLSIPLPIKLQKMLVAGATDLKDLKMNGEHCDELCPVIPKGKFKLLDLAHTADEGIISSISHDYPYLLHKLSLHNNELRFTQKTTLTNFSDYFEIFACSHNVREMTVIRPLSDSDNWLCGTVKESLLVHVNHLNLIGFGNDFDCDQLSDLCQMLSRAPQVVVVHDSQYLNFSTKELEVPPKVIVTLLRNATELRKLVIKDLSPELSVLLTKEFPSNKRLQALEVSNVTPAAQDLKSVLKTFSPNVTQLSLHVGTELLAEGLGPLNGVLSKLDNLKILSYSSGADLKQFLKHTINVEKITIPLRNHFENLPKDLFNDLLKLKTVCIDYGEKLKQAYGIITVQDKLDRLICEYPKLDIKNNLTYVYFTSETSYKTYKRLMSSASKCLGLQMTCPEDYLKLLRTGKNNPIGHKAIFFAVEELSVAHIIEIKKLFPATRSLVTYNHTYSLEDNLIAGDAEYQIQLASMSEVTENATYLQTNVMDEKRASYYCTLSTEATQLYYVCCQQDPANKNCKEDLQFIIKKEKCQPEFVSGTCTAATNEVMQQSKNLGVPNAAGNKNYHVRKIFYPFDSIVKKPHPSENRLASYQDLTLKASCQDNNIASLSNTDGMDLKPAVGLTFSQDCLIGCNIKTITKANKTYYLALPPTCIASDEWTLLPSLDANETIVQMHTIPQIEMEVMRSERDGFYYFRKSKDKTRSEVTFDYIIETSPSIENPSDNVKEFVEFCRAFTPGDLDMTRFTNPTPLDYIEEMGRQQKGACEQRSLYFKYKMDQKGIPCRMIQNQSHTFVEVYEHEIWTKYDLGGDSSAKTTIHESPTYTAHQKGDCFFTGSRNRQLQYDDKFDVVEGIVQVDRLIEIFTEHAPKNMIIDGKVVLCENEVILDELPETPLALPARKPMKNYFTPPAKQEFTDSSVYIDTLLNLDREKSKRLIKCTSEQLTPLAYQISCRCHAKEIPHLEVDETSKLMIDGSYIDSGKIKRGYHGDVYRFLQNHKNTRCVLVLNLKHFLPHDLVRFNSLFDEQPYTNLDRFPIPDTCQIITLLDSQRGIDASLESRFNGAIEFCPVSKENIAPAPPFEELEADKENLVDPLIIDFHLGPWRGKILDEWQLSAGGIKLIPSSFLQKLRSEEIPKHVILKNAPNDSDLVRFIRLADLYGYIEHNGECLEWPRPTVYTLDKYAFDSAMGCLVRLGYRSAANCKHIINPHNFAKFFKQYYCQIAEGSTGALIEQAGILANYTAQETIGLYMSESLTSAQWSRLLEECAARNIMLTIALAPAVTLPADELSTKLTKCDNMELDEASLSETLTDVVISSTDIDLTVAQRSVDKVICIDVSELQSSQLLQKIEGGLNEANLSLEFTEQTGALLQSLKNDQTVILHGEFSREMRQALQIAIFDRQRNTPPGRVMIICNETTASFFEGLAPVVTHNVNDLEKLSQLANPPHYMIDTSQPFVMLQAQTRLSAGSWVGLNDELPQLETPRVVDLSSAKEKAQAYDQKRLHQLDNALAQSPVAIITGLTGVGKTIFVTDVWQQAQANRRVYLGEQSIRDWATDRALGSKVLFIDEANLAGKNWSQFEGMFNNDPPGIMLDNTFVELTPEHKVVFAMNPNPSTNRYSDDRCRPTLFERRGNSIYFDPLSPEYIYQKILLPIFADDETTASKICQPILELNQYLNRLSQQAVLLSPRELKMMVQLSINFCQAHRQCSFEEVAKYFSYELSHQFVPEEHVDEFKKQFSCAKPPVPNVCLSEHSTFIVTESNQTLLEMLGEFLNLRQSKIDGKTQLLDPGLGGIVFEGEPGLGKSELAMAYLQSLGFVERTMGDDGHPDDQQHYYHLSAASNIQVKHEILTKAFHEGVVVLYDEINAAASLERLLNSLLMGKGPGGECAANPGFMLIGTQNPSATSSGRIKTSYALLHRMHYRVIKHYSKQEMQTILVKTGLPQVRIDQLIAQYETVRSNANQQDQWCFRHLLTSAKLESERLSGVDSKGLNYSQMLSYALNAETNAETLELIYFHSDADDKIKDAILNNPASDSALLLMILDQTNTCQLENLSKILNHPQTDDNVLLKLIHQFAHQINLFDILNHPYCTKELLTEVAKASDDIELLTRVARFRVASSEALKAIADKVADYETLEIILTHPGCDDKVLAHIIDQTQDVNVLIAIIFNDAASTEVLLTLIEKLKSNPLLLRLILSRHFDNARVHLALVQLAGADDIEILTNIITATTDEEYPVLCEIVEKTSSLDVLNKIYHQTSNVDVLECMATKQDLDFDFVMKALTKYITELLRGIKFDFILFGCIVEILQQLNIHDVLMHPHCTDQIRLGVLLHQETFPFDVVDIIKSKISISDLMIEFSPLRNLTDVLNFPNPLSIQSFPKEEFDACLPIIKNGQTATKVDQATVKKKMGLDDIPLRVYYISENLFLIFSNSSAKVACKNLEVIMNSGELPEKKLLTLRIQFLALSQQQREHAYQVLQTLALRATTKFNDHGIAKRVRLSPDVVSPTSSYEQVNARFMSLQTPLLPEGQKANCTEKLTELNMGCVSPLKHSRQELADQGLFCAKRPKTSLAVGQRCVAKP